jgi:hypothetical protein
MRLVWHWLLCSLAALPVPLLSETPQPCFTISVVDDATGRGVPLVELKTVGNVTYYTDSNGLVAFYEPGLMDRRIYFSIQADGYEYPEDGFGYRGKAFDIHPGGSGVIKLHRTEIAERLYRLTGEGIYRDTVLAGRKPPIEQPLVNGGVTGTDGPQTVLYRGKVFWFFGDTGGLDYPLGNFASTGATSQLPSQGGLDPAVGVNLHYFVRPDGFVKPMLDIPGDGPKWMGGLMVLKDPSGHERLVTDYERVREDMSAKERGLAVYDDDTATFHKLADFPANSNVVFNGRPLLARSRGHEYYQCGTSTLPWIRVKADWDQVQRLENYEVYTCYRPSAGLELERDPDGRLVCGWKSHAAPMLWDDQKALIASGKMKPEEGMWQMRDADSGQPIEVRDGSVFWNPYRKRWIAIFQRSGGAVYFAEADTPVGPWVYAKSVAEFERYTFYWPGQLPYFDQDGGRTIYFAGTYTAAFSSAPFQTPRYDYNVLMYRLRLDDPRLALPVPVYRTGGRYLLREGIEAEAAWGRIDGIPFFAVPPDAAHDSLIAIYASPKQNGTVMSTEARGSSPLFYALPGAPPPPAAPAGLPGKWSCEARLTDGSELTSFALDLEVEGEHVHSGDPGDTFAVEGTSHGGNLQLRIMGHDETYALAGELKEGKLAGTWQSQTEPIERGNWHCERSPVPRQPKSAAVVPLFEYTNVADGSRVYSTEPRLADKALKRSPHPLCRVWRAPMSQLIIDPEAEPVVAAGPSKTPQ